MDKDPILSKIKSLYTYIVGLETDDFKLPSDVKSKFNDIEDDVDVIANRISEVNQESKGRKEKLRVLTTDFDKKSADFEEVSGKFTKSEEQVTQLKDQIKSSDDKLEGYHTQQRADLKSIIESNNIVDKENITKYLSGDIKELDKMSNDDVQTNIAELNKLKDLKVFEAVTPSQTHQIVDNGKSKETKTSDLKSLYK